MKKSELTQLTKLIEHLVSREIKKQLPGIIAETFQNMMGGKMVVTEKRRPAPVVEEQVEPEVEELPEEEATNFKASLRELFAGTPKSPPTAPTRQAKQYTKNPVLNQILNETVPDLRAREGMVGMAAFQGGYSPAVGMAAAAAGAMPSMTGVGEMMPESEQPSFSRNMPTMPQAVSPAAMPVAHPQPLREGQEGGPAPLENIPQGISVLDVARSGAIQVPAALTDFSHLKKILDASKNRR